jgi:hypothetical protein
MLPVLRILPIPKTYLFLKQQRLSLLMVVFSILIQLDMPVSLAEKHITGTHLALNKENEVFLMRKTLILIFALTLILAIPVQASAVTPPLRVPDMPEIPEIKVEVKLSDDYWNNYFRSNPFKIDWSKIWR